MRRLESLFKPVVSAIVAFATLAIATFSSTSRSTAHPAEGPGTRRAFRQGPRHARGWKPRGIHAVPLVAVLAIGATAFAAGAGTPTGAGVTEGTLAAPSVTVTTIAPATTASTTQAPASAVPVTQAPTTTPAPTTTQAPPPTTAAPAPPPVQTGVSGACGGNLPPCCVMMRESGGNPTAVNQSSGASGKWQFMPGTWANYGGYPTAASAPEWVQDERAAQIWAGGAGAGHWGGGC